MCIIKLTALCIFTIFTYYLLYTAVVVLQDMYYVITLTHYIYLILTYSYVPDTCDMPVCNNDPTLCPGYMMCEPVPLPFFNTIDEVCVIVFTIEFTFRLFLCWAVPPS